MKKILSLLITSLVFLAPAFADHRLGVMINEKEHKCAAFRQASECSRAVLPSGWNSVMASDGETSAIAHNGKNCTYDPKAAADCCKTLGYTFAPEMKPKYEPNGLEKDPKSACYQLSAEKG